MLVGVWLVLLALFVGGSRGDAEGTVRLQGADAVGAGGSRGDVEGTVRLRGADAVGAGGSRGDVEGTVRLRGGDAVGAGGSRGDVEGTVRLQGADAVGAGGSRGDVEGTVRLRGGDAVGAGNVLVYHDGRWGGVCDDGWGRNSADVVCRMLGYPRAVAQTMASYFGNVKSKCTVERSEGHVS